jgi:CO/xanthine dehydrogenase FAD-binding subunit
VPGFRYRRPATLGETLDLLASGADTTRILAGGQSLLPMISFGLAQPRVIVDINYLPGLDYAVCEDEVVAIGPLKRHRALEQPGPALVTAAPLVPLAAALIGHVAIRNRGTFLGSLRARRSGSGVASGRCRPGRGAPARESAR